MSPLLVLACSETKLPVHQRMTPFAQVYDGPMWQQVKASGFPLDRVAAISALYGFLEPGSPIETYNVRMDEEHAARHCNESNHVPRLANAIRAAGAAFVVGGELYRRLAHAAIQYAPDIAELVTFASGSFLEQRKQLGEWLRANVDAPVQAELF